MRVVKKWNTETRLPSVRTLTASITHLACARIATIAKGVTRWQHSVSTQTANSMQEASARLVTCENIIIATERRKIPPNQIKLKIKLRIHQHWVWAQKYQSNRTCSLSLYSMDRTTFSPILMRVMTPHSSWTIKIRPLNIGIGSQLCVRRWITHCLPKISNLMRNEEQTNLLFQKI